MEGLQSVEELKAAMVEYQGQMEQVEDLLRSEPGNAEGVEMRQQLLEVMQLTEELIQISATSADCATSAEFATSADATLAASDETAELEAPQHIIGPLPPSAPGSAAPEIGPGWPSETREEASGGATNNSGDATPGDIGLPGHARPTPAGQSEGRGQKRGRRGTMHPRNKYAELVPDFDELADKYPLLRPYVMGARGGRRTIEWTDFNATRELTRALLHHDYGVTWTLPDGNLCPTLTNRANYIHWIEDLLSLSPRPPDKRAKKAAENTRTERQVAEFDMSTERQVAGIDIGTGANCIYPLLGASINGWRFVGTDITAASLASARANVEANPHLASLVEIRSASWQRHVGADLAPPAGGEREGEGEGERGAPPVLVGVVGETESFDFCMCNPPFFESMDEAGANPRTACGGTEAEMVCEGGEDGFIRQIIADSLVLKDQIHWYTTMVGRKTNMKTLVEILRKKRIPTIRTTEFVQGRTSRWGLAWSFSSEPSRDQLRARSGVTAPPRTKISFNLQGLGKRCQASDVLAALASQLSALGASCSPDPRSFTVAGSAPLSSEPKELATWNHQLSKKEDMGGDGEPGRPPFQTMGPDCPNWGGGGSEGSQRREGGGTFNFQVSVFQQAPGALSLAASLLKDGSAVEGSEAAFSSLFERVESAMRSHFKIRR